MNCETPQTDSRSQMNFVGLPIQPVTVEQEFNILIAQCRSRLEELCIAKAKAETLGLAKAPVHDLRKILGSVI